jgi:DnaJ-class molecular chaperone
MTPGEKQGSKPGDEAKAGTPATGENVCPKCRGSGRIGGEQCTECRGSGKVTTGIGGA